MRDFITHKLEVIRGDDERLIYARISVADEMRKNAIAIRNEDPYADHVSEDQKDLNKKLDIQRANEVEVGMHDNCFAVWQRINYKLTGECPAFCHENGKRNKT